LLFCARVAGEVLIGTELNGINKNAYNDSISLLAGRPDQLNMTVMQIAHGGDKGNFFSSLSPGVYGVF
jgi:hypothetical protein